MLCPSCRRQLERGASFCGSCGTPLNGGSAPLELVLADATRIPVVSEMTIGRAPGASLVLSDPSVSRVHARITADAVLEDAGSSHGTWLDGVRVTGPSPLHDGAKIRLGDAELRVERRREVAEAGRTIVVRAGASLLVPSVGAAGGHLDALRDAPAGALGLRAQAARRVRGTQALGAEGPSDRRVPAALGQRRVRLRAARRLVLAGRADRARRAALRRHRAGAAGAAADRPRRARVPGRRGRRPAAGGGAGGAPAAAVQAAREDVQVHRAGDREALPRGRLGVLHQARADRARGADRARHRRVRVPDRRPLRDAVRGRVEVRLGRSRVPARAVRRGRGARDRARVDDGVVRAPDRARGAEGDRDLPVRVRGHLGGVVRDAPAADRGVGRGPGLGLRAGRSVRAVRAAAARRASSATSSSTSRSRRTSAGSSTSTRSSSATATTSSSTGCRSRGCGGARRSSSSAGSRARAPRPTRRC